MFYLSPGAKQHTPSVKGYQRQLKDILFELNCQRRWTGMTRESCGFGSLQNNKLPTSCAVLSPGDVLVACQPQLGGGLREGGQVNNPGDRDND